MMSEENEQEGGTHGPPSADTLLTYAEVCRDYKVKRGTLFFWVSQRAIPHIRLGPRSVRFRRRDLERWLAARSVPACNPITDEAGR